MSRSLWPDFSGSTAPRGMMEMLHDAAGDIGEQTDGKLKFYVDLVGVGEHGPVESIRYNCYLHLVSRNYFHLLFQVTTPLARPFPATVATPEGDDYPELRDESELRNVIGDVLQRERTREIVFFLLNDFDAADARSTGHSRPR